MRNTGIEQELTRKMAAGDAASWTMFMQDHASIIMRTIVATIRRYANTAQETDADDVFQDVMLRLVADQGRLLRTFDAGRASLRTWLAVVSRSTTLDALRRRPRHEDELSETLLERLCAPAVETPNLDGPLFPHQALSARQNHVMSLLFERDMDVRDVANLLCIGEQTVRSLKHQAITKLRALHLYGEPAAATA